MADEVPLSEVASIIRSKNAGPFRITLDIVFDDEATYRAVVASRRVSRESVGRLYGLAPEEVAEFVEFHPGRAIKITIPRLVSSGAVGDTDVYGAQQGAPLLSILLPAEVAKRTG